MKGIDRIPGGIGVQLGLLDDFLLRIVQLRDALRGFAFQIASFVSCVIPFLARGLGVLLFQGLVLQLRLFPNDFLFRLKVQLRFLVRTFVEYQFLNLFDRRVALLVL